MPKLVTISVRNLPLATEPIHVSQHFREIDPDCQPHVSSLFNDYGNDGRTILARCATVTLRVRVASFKKAESAIHSLRQKSCQRVFRIGRDEREISFDEDFRGIKTLYEHQHGAQVDYVQQASVYLIHGLGGHAFSTWANKTEGDDTSRVKMWARDFLSSDLERENIKARVATIGYNGNWSTRVDQQASIQTIAEGLLGDLRADRGRSSKRPMVFVCHSLGGIILCKALALAMHRRPGYGVDAAQYTDLFVKGASTLVKGIVFLGTPFQGSLVASNVDPLVEALSFFNPFPMNRGLVSALSYGNPDLQDIVSCFKSLQKEQGFEVWIGCETDPMKTQLIVSRESAISVFCDGARDGAQVMTLSGSSHAGLARYDSPNGIYVLIRKGIVGMIKGDAPRSLGVGTDNRRNRSRSNSIDNSLVSRSREPSPGPGVSRRATGQMLGTGEPFGVNDLSARLGTIQLGQVEAPQDPPSFEIDSGSSRTLRPAKIEAGPSRDRTAFSRSQKFDTCFIFDDTPSMQYPAEADKKGQPNALSKWSVVEKFMEQIIENVISNDNDGVDVMFLKKTSLNEKRIRNSQKVLSKLMSVRGHLENLESRGATFFEDALREALAPMVPRWIKYKEAISSGDPDHTVIPPMPKPLNVILITDGESDDTEEVGDLIRETAEDLDRSRAPRRLVGIQFLQVGDDLKAAKWLHELDNDLHSKHQSQGFRDIVDTTYWKPSAATTDAKTLVKALLGAVTKEYDSVPTQMPSP